jgi:hypothetical protein
VLVDLKTGAFTHADAVVKYATGGIQAQVFASKYPTDLPDEETLRREIMSTRRALGEGRMAPRS